MRTIQINDDVYIYLLSRTAYIGEDASSILRRLLDIPENEAGQEDPGRHLSANHKDQNSSRVSRNGVYVRFSAQNHLTSELLRTL